MVAPELQFRAGGDPQRGDEITDESQPLVHSSFCPREAVGEVVPSFCYT